MDVGWKEKGWKDRPKIVSGHLGLWFGVSRYFFTTCMALYVYSALSLEHCFAHTSASVSALVRSRAEFLHHLGGVTWKVEVVHF